MAALHITPERVGREKILHSQAMSLERLYGII